MLGRCGELEMPFGNYCDSAHLRALQSQRLTCQNTKQRICLECDIQHSFMQARLGDIWNRFKTILRNTTVHDAFYREHHLMAYFTSKALEGFGMTTFCC